MNCYATNDWLLALLYRSKTYELGVAGLGCVYIDGQEKVPSSEKRTEVFSCSVSEGVENIDVTDLIRSHSDYPCVLPSIMRRVHLN